MSKGIFITGTGTDIGKTFVTGLILKKLAEADVSAAYFKAAMSGNIRDESGVLIPGDAAEVKRVSGIKQPVTDMCPYVYENAVSPHLASKIEGGPVEINVVLSGYKKLAAEYDIIIAEGSGGIVCPIRYDEKQILLEDIIRSLDLPCLIVADAGLGTINSVVLTTEYMRKRSLNVKGIIFNDYNDSDIMHRDNRSMCEELTGIPVLACVSHGCKDIDIDAAKIISMCE